MAERNERMAEKKVESIARQPERKPSAFRMISQLVGEDSPSISNKASSPGYEQRERHEVSNVGAGIRAESRSKEELERVEEDEEEDEEIDVQDSDQDVPSSPTVGAWRDHWTEQQPLELTKHDR